jgi:anthranilate phosphoribosyltransferase
MFAPHHHGATRYVVPVRKQLAVRTIFNFLGPLTNPAGARRQVIGVSDPRFLTVVAGAAAELGVEKAMVCTSEDGLDELSISAPTHVVEASGAEYDVAPEDVGLERASLDAVRGGTPEQNAEIVRRIFAGETGPRRDLAVLNAGAAIYVAGRAEDLASGVRAAEAAIDEGRAGATLEQLAAGRSEREALSGGERSETVA